MMIQHPVKDFYMDDTLHDNIIELPKRINKDKDAVALICGDPGNGKSTIVSQIGFVLSPSIINEACYHSTVEDFRKYAVSLKPTKGRVNIHDEARETGGMNVVTKRIRRHWDFIYENRFLNMYQILIQSDFWNTPRHIVYHRAQFMVWVIESDEWDNGLFLFYSKKAMRSLYERGKRHMDRTPRGYDFQGKFVSFWAGNPNYLEEKSKNFYSKYVEKEEGDKEISIKEVLFWIWDRNPGIEPSKVIKVLNISESSYFTYMRNYKLQAMA